MTKEMKRTLLAKSSSGIPYKVVFEIRNENLIARCGCQAGIHRRLCKHIRKLALADKSMLHDQEEGKELIDVTVWLQKSGFLESLSQYNTIKNEIDHLKRQETKIRNKLEVIMKVGLPIR